MKNSALLNIRLWLTAIFSTACGMAIAWIDALPNWDDTGITAGMLFLSSALAGFITAEKLWLWALLTGIWIPVAAITRNGDALMLLVLIISFGGSYSGGLIRKMVSSAKREK
jgi:hypothetical protein